jgi:hypothetical protein
VTREGWIARLGRSAWTWPPLLIVIVLAAPSIPFLLPSYYCHLGESYQPLRALRFFSSLGADFHKYGPAPNFLLAPGYALSLGWWWLEGTFAHPSPDFPYGFANPLEQLTALILQGRIVFLVLFVGLFAYLMHALRAATGSRLAIVLAFSFCVATNYCAVGFAAFTRPDGPMLALLGASLGVYTQILHRGLDVRRGVWLSLLAVAAISCKEVAGPVYVLPYLGLLARVWIDRSADPEKAWPTVKAALAMLAAGVLGYLALNVVYAPGTWLVRMQHWLGGSGADSAVWGGVASGEMTRLEFLGFLAGTFLNNLGPGGLPVVLAALVALALACRRNALMLALPFVSTLALALLPLGYGADYFTAVAVVALVPPVAVGLDELLRRARAAGASRALASALAVALGVNLWFANFAWVRLDGLFPKVVERALAEDPPGERAISLPDVFPEVPGKSRLAWLGHRVDPRSLQQLVDADPDSLPDRIYLSSGMRGFIEDAMAQPARAEMLREEGLDVARWKGIESLGYRLERTVETPTPAWFPFRWMPAVDLWERLSPVYVYERASR